MGDEMGTFRVNVEIANPARPGERRVLESVLVDTGAELSWFPAAALESRGADDLAAAERRQRGRGLVRAAAFAGEIAFELAGARQPACDPGGLAER